MMKIPSHIAIIMDGNGRWAKKRGLPRAVGHRRGINRVKEIVRYAKKLGIKILTIFAFSTENWNRPEKEIKFLFSHLVTFLDNYKKELIEENIKFKVIGRRDRIYKGALEKIKEIEAVTKNNKSFIFNVALDYGGRWDIVRGVKRMAQDCISGRISQEDIDERLFSGYLSLNGTCDPDFLIRTSGEQRISNFLIWNLAYSEFYFTPTLWPDFDKKQLHKAVEAFSKRNRKFGEIHE